jgi:DNA-binding NtrC family response regulator
MPAILIADADQDLCDLFEQFFSHQGWQVRTFGGALECLAQLRQCPPQLLILDADLPWGGADGLLAVMRDDPALARVPVILTSTEGSLEAHPRLLSPPVVQVLEKPFPLAALLERAHSAVETRQPGQKKDSRGWPHPAFAPDG